MFKYYLNTDKARPYRFNLYEVARRNKKISNILDRHSNDNKAKHQDYHYTSTAYTD